MTNHEMQKIKWQYYEPLSWDQQEKISLTTIVWRLLRKIKWKVCPYKINEKLAVSRFKDLGMNKYTICHTVFLSSVLRQSSDVRQQKKYKQLDLSHFMDFLRQLDSTSVKVARNMAYFSGNNIISSICQRQREMFSLEFITFI